MLDPPVIDKLTLYAKRLLIITTASALLCGLIISIAALLSRQTFLSFQDWIEVFGSVGSLILSVLLVVIYLRLTELESEQVEINSQQSEIQATQNSIMKYQQKPMIEIQDHEIGKAIEILDIEAQPDSSSYWKNATGIELTLENKGRGLAEDLRLEFSGVIGTEESFEGLEECGIFIVGTGLYGGDIDTKTSLMSGRSGSLPQNDTRRLVTTVATNYTQDSNKDIIDIADEVEAEPISLGEALTRLDTQINVIILKIELSYRYLGGYSDEEVLFRAAANPDRIDSIADFFESGNPISYEEAAVYSEYIEENF
jgi:hypothetical protein